MSKAIEWLKQSALPIWSKQNLGWDAEGFTETITFDEIPQNESRRSMVQARQIYSMRIAYDLGLIDKATLDETLASGSRALLKCRNANGGFHHAIGKNGELHKDFDLYTQAFVIFALAYLYDATKEPKYSSIAEGVLDYLYSERSVNGGFTEIKGGQVSYDSNPHMHLFEAALAWLEFAPSKRWQKLADDIVELSTQKFIDKNTGYLGEYFDQNWNSIDQGNRFVFEPGHQFEWAWLFGNLQKLSDRNLMSYSKSLVANAEKVGVNKKTGTAIDELWSDGSIKKPSSRFWPQCERIKANSQLFRTTQEESYRLSATQSLDALIGYFKTEKPGLWYDSFDNISIYTGNPSKASSLYHIIGAISEFEKMQ